MNLIEADLIGIGFLGRVYKTKKVGYNEFLCVKIIPLDKFKDDIWKISQKLKNKAENLIIYSYMEKFDDENLVVLEMEYMDGGDLKTYIDNYKGFLSEKLIFSVINQIGNYFNSFFHLFYIILFYFFI
jgi:serine/threonine protein kinase